jgi:glycosyltransferase involved in cell wall biosynthesis
MTSSNPVKVSVCMITYNHENYIAQAIESVLMQKTTFEYEILIGEDCSTDSTRDIVFDYQERYPEIIKTIFHKSNVGPQNNFSQTLKACTGQYIAILEGDDYWLSPDKLQNQADILDIRADISFCFHNNLIIDENDMDSVHFSNTNQSVITTIEDIIDCWYVMTCSIMFRSSFLNDLPPWFFNFKNGDYILQLLLSTRGPVYYIDEIMGVYRQQKWGLSRTFMGYDLQYIIIDLLLNFNYYTNNQYEKSIHKRISNLYKKLSLCYKSDRNISKFLSCFFKNIYYYPPHSLADLINLCHYLVPYHEVHKEDKRKLSAFL